MTITVLAGSYKETNAFARQKGLGFGIRHIVSARTLEGARPTEIHVLPSFYARRDFHAVNATLKRVVRKVHDPKRVEYELTDDGEYVVASAPEIALGEPEVVKSKPKPRAKPALKPRAKPKTKAEPKTPRVNAVVEDTSADAVPGQIAIDELAPDAPRPSVPGREKFTVSEKDEYLANLEPEGFELSDDPAEQAQQILKSAAHFADRDDDVTEQNFRSAPDDDVLDFLDD
jgi:hypothetical protein